MTTNSICLDSILYSSLIDNVLNYNHWSNKFNEISVTSTPEARVDEEKF